MSQPEDGRTKNPLLTVSVAAYEVEDTIESALASLTDPRVVDDIEVLVVDDGGRDGTMARVERYAASFPSIHPVYKENGGYGSVINRTIGLARGKYFKQLDGDDWYKTDHLASLVAMLGSCDADCIITPRLNVDQSRRREHLVDCLEDYPEGLYTFDQVTFRPAMGMHEICYRTRILQAMDKSLSEHCFYTDVELVYLPLPLLETLYVSHQPIYCHRVGVDGQSISKRGVRAHYREHERVLWRLLDTYQSLPDSDSGKRRVLGQRLVDEICGQFHWFCYLSPTPAHMHELIAFDRRLRGRCPELVDQASRASRRVSILRKSRFLAYPILCAIEATR
ncbi:glycosyltransferase family 2 protein [Bifidobacterium aemilianum]|nr:glycosyltransferase family A protein [Bifidobacterium aemilianum]